MSSVPFSVQQPTAREQEDSHPPGQVVREAGRALQADGQVFHFAGHQGKVVLKLDPILRSGVTTLTM
jgi:hypothetical protein